MRDGWREGTGRDACTTIGVGADGGASIAVTSTGVIERQLNVPASIETRAFEEIRL